MKIELSIYDFRFTPSGFGAYWVTYISPVTRKSWGKRVTNMELIDATKNAAEPKKKDLQILKRLCKSA